MIMSRVYTNRICGINIENSIASKSKGINATIGVFLMEREITCIIFYTTKN